MANENSDRSPVNRLEQSKASSYTLKLATRKLAWQWLGANVLGFAIATPLSFITTLYIAGLIVGATVGPLQALVIQSQLPRLRLWQWVLANIVGSYVGAWAGFLMLSMILAMLPLFNAPSLENMSVVLISTALYGAIIGMIVGIAQIFSFPAQAQNIAQWWTANLMGRTLGWLSASLLGWGIFAVTKADNFLMIWGPLLGAAGGAVYALATTKALLKLKG